MQFNIFDKCIEEPKKNLNIPNCSHGWNLSCFYCNSSFIKDGNDCVPYTFPNIIHDNLCSSSSIVTDVLPINFETNLASELSNYPTGINIVRIQYETED